MPFFSIAYKRFLGQRLSTGGPTSLFFFFYPVGVSIYCWQWRLRSVERLMIIPGTEQMEWHQTPGNHVFDVFDTIPLIPLQSLPRARAPQLWCHQPPVLLRVRKVRYTRCNLDISVVAEELEAELPYLSAPSKTRLCISSFSLIISVTDSHSISPCQLTFFRLVS